MALLILLFPMMEIAAWWMFIRAYSFGDAVLWCLLSAFVGFLIMKSQGTGASEEVQAALRSGQAPPRRLAHRLLIAVGAFLLVLPGLLTDVFGALLILPGLRHLFVRAMMKKFTQAVQNGRFAAQGDGPFGTFVFTQTIFRGGGRQASRDVTPAKDVIDVQATVLRDELPPGGGKSPGS